MTGFKHASNCGPTGARQGEWNATPHELTFLANTPSSVSFWTRSETFCLSPEIVTES